MRSIFLWIIVAGNIGAEPDAPSLFELCQPEKTGVDYVHRFAENHPRAYLYYSGSAVGALCLGDVDGDSLLDLYVSGAAGNNAFFLNRGEMKFSTQELPDAARGDKNWGTGAALVDIDGDGDLDLYQCNYDAPNQLFLNDGKGKFAELAGAAGLDVKDASLQATFADIDNDGDLDMFLLCNEYFSPHGRPAKVPVVYSNGLPEISAEYSKHFKIKIDVDGEYSVAEYGRKDYLFLNEGVGNDGKLRFRDISLASGVQMEGWGLSSAWWDYDGDGDLDLYVANDFTVPDRLFRNDGVQSNGIPSFTNVINDVFPHTSWSSMGSDVADFNHDGMPDLVIAEMASTTHYKSKTSMGALTPLRRQTLTQSMPRQYMRNHLLVNTGMNQFQESAIMSGVSSSNWSWTAKFGDLDNDGYQDLFFTNGMVRDLMNADRETEFGNLDEKRIGKTMWELEKDAPEQPEKNMVFQNTNGRKFKKKADWGLGLLGMSYSSAMGDLDNDGDLDLVVSDLGKNTKIYRNHSKDGNNIRISLTGTKSNRMGLGSRVVVTDDRGIKRIRWMNPYTGYLSQNDSVLHVGLGEAEAKKVEVYWPSGTYQNVPLSDSKWLKVVEKEVGTRPEQKPVNPRFVPANAPDYVHKDKDFDDFKVEPLLPQKLSQLGPCLAKGDIDGDGDEDFFVGGAHGQEGAVFLNDSGTFKRSKQPALSGLAKYAEDNAAIWFDADGDKDLDLLVVTGSTEYELDDTLYKDRLYLNQIKNGVPVLEPAPDGAFPFLLDSGSCVVTADYDGDGDLDLFIGSRSIPGKYPLSPQSRLIRNDSSSEVVKFTDVSKDSLKLDRMVTDAVWADIDQDNDPDLCVSTDWGPVIIYQNNGGKLVDVSSSVGTASHLGWWRSIHAVDVDGDGDLDLVAGNTGTNTKYKHPSDKYPAMLYYGDLDGSGTNHIVEAKIDKDRDRPLPVRGRY
ncbi:hypothetical protein NT6N_19180 [Oceaniferula spumae]|uniref:ASPIC/UnbV domain-containing protein n=1 Tax=Oceaniferula spumae TaxID=2979115 RepID=A0AAT9FLP8_9BACT